MSSSDKDANKDKDSAKPSSSAEDMLKKLSLKDVQALFGNSSVRFPAAYHPSTLQYARIGFPQMISATETAFKAALLIFDLERL